MKKVLVVIDMQNDFVTGALGNEAAQKAIPKVVQLIKNAIKNNDMIIFTQDTHYNNYLDTAEGKKLPVPHCIMKTWGWEIIPECMDLVRDCLNVRFCTKYSFGKTDWYDSSLVYCDEIIICGLVSSICVVSNALILKATYPEKPITFVSNASAGLNIKNHIAAIEIMKSCQIDIAKI